MGFVRRSFLRFLKRVPFCFCARTLTPSEHRYPLKPSDRLIAHDRTDGYKKGSKVSGSVPENELPTVKSVPRTLGSKALSKCSSVTSPILSTSPLPPLAN